MKTCTIHAEVLVDHVVVRSKDWHDVDIMRTSHTRGWTTRQFNLVLADMHSCTIGRGKAVHATWEAEYEEVGRVRGSLSGINGRLMKRRGVFEE